MEPSVRSRHPHDNITPSVEMPAPFPVYDSAMAEKELLELEALLHKPKPEFSAPRALESAKAACAGFLPTSWLSSQVTYSSSSTTTATTPPSAASLKRLSYLDGLRGFAALLVYSLHHQVWGHSGTHGEFILEEAFGWKNAYYFACLPGVRVFFSGGHFAVAIFFVISGYVLSSKPLSLIHARETTTLADNIGSALFRRWLRLFLPVAGVTFAWMTSWHVLGIRNPVTAAPEKTWFDEIWKWYCDFKNYSFIFNGEVFNAYNDHAWSIPMEFRGSIVVYTAVLAFARCKTSTRLQFELGLIFYFLYIVDGWYCALFAAGMFLCDIDMLARKNQLPATLERLWPKPTWAYYIIFFVALYLGGVPSITNDFPHLGESPGWWFLSLFKPQAVYDFRWFYRFWAATLMMIAIPRISWLRAFFETSFCQYLGRVSFGFYLVHGPVLWTLGDRVYAATGLIREGHISVIPGWMNLFPFPHWGPFGLEVNFLLPHLILLPVTLWLAELVTTLFDEPSVKFSQWLFKNSNRPEHDLLRPEVI